MTGSFEVRFEREKMWYVIRYLRGAGTEVSEERLRIYAGMVLRLQEKLRDAGIAYRVYYREIDKPDLR